MGLPDHPDHKLYASVPIADAADFAAVGNAKAKFDPKWASLDADNAPWWRQPRTQRFIKAGILTLVALNAAFAIWGLACGPPRGLDGIECLHALGGGNASHAGSFDSAIVHGPHCRRVLANYLRPGGAYWHEVDIAAGRAFDYFRAAAPARGPNDTIVFDIDETVLSNIDEFLNATRGCHRHPRHHRHLGPPDGLDGHVGPQDGPHDGPDGPHGPGHDHEHHHRHHHHEDDDDDEEEHRHHHHHHHHHDDDDDEEEEHHHHHHHRRHHDDKDDDDEPRVIRKPLQLGAPPLPPMLRLYRFLYEQGYIVTFVTGRGEESRNHTEANLAAAGFGSRCPADPATGAVLRSADGEPCWLQLDMRAAGDERLASVYKPERRGRLVARGFKLVGSFGDQFSDLEGENSAEASFKLPNPMYYIL